MGQLSYIKYINLSTSKLSFLICLSSYLVVALLLMCFAPHALAKSSNPTSPLVGHKPLLKPFTLPVGSITPDAAAGATEPVSDHAKVGALLMLADMGIDLPMLVNDTDGDTEFGSQVEWLIDGHVISTGNSFKPVAAHGGQNLSVRATPRTQTGTPDIGNSVTSNSIVVRSTLAYRFLTPKMTLLNWPDAN